MVISYHQIKSAPKNVPIVHSFVQSHREMALIIYSSMFVNVAHHDHELDQALKLIIVLNLFLTWYQNVSAVHIQLLISVAVVLPFCFIQVECKNLRQSGFMVVFTLLIFLFLLN